MHRLGCALVLLAMSAGAHASPATLSEIQSRLRLRFEGESADSMRSVAGDRIHSSRVLGTFYEGRLYRPAWSEGSPAHLSTLAAAVVDGLRNAGRQGLEPLDYHLSSIDHLWAELPRAKDPVGVLVDLDIAISDGLLTYASHMVTGRVDPAACDAQWISVGEELDLATWLEQLVSSGNLTKAMAEIEPHDPGYRRLVAALAAYRRIQASGGWRPIDDGPTLEAGAQEPRVLQLRRRLAASGFSTRAKSRPDEFDEILVAALKRFQERHGLQPDGRLGAQTLAALNVPVESRVRQIELNLERWRWLPLSFGSRYIIVNVPSFELSVKEGEETAMTLKVVVGKTYTKTPVFSEQMRYLVLNPYWEIPREIAVKEQLPLIRKDPSYLGKEKIRVLEGWGAEEREIDPATVDWTSLGPGNFPYRLRQDPGPLNALGQIKFMFPNAFNVYLHDTPAKGLFAQTRRDLSHGCIRVEKPLELAAYLMAGTNWTREALEGEIASGRQTVLPLAVPMPIYIEYWTAWVDADERVQFRRDIYERDATLDRALQIACGHAG